MRKTLDCEFLVAELKLAIQLVQVGDMPDALDAIEIAREHIKDWLTAPFESAIEGRVRE